MLLKDAIERLAEAGVEYPEQDARVIFEDIGGISRHLLAFRDTECSSREVEEAVERRIAGEPLQYIIGKVAFYREEYKVAPDCLIPREDTEILVDYAVGNLPRGARFLDLCTGSGCIAVSTLKNTCETAALAVDISEGALTLARENATANGVSDRLKLLRLDLLEEGEELVGEKYAAVLSNPPYVSLDEYGQLARELYREPRIALTDEGDGSGFYKRLVPLSKDLIDDSGFIALEIGYRQGELLRALAKENRLTVEILRDLSGNERVAVLRPMNDRR